MTQYEKRSIYIASANYRMRKKEKKLRREITVFFTAFGAVCAMLYFVISSLPY